LLSRRQGRSEALVCSRKFGNVIAFGGYGVVIASQPGHRLPALTAEQNAALATTPADEMLKLPMLQPDEATLPPTQTGSIGKSARTRRPSGCARHAA
jgi:hypothetical protein